MNTCEPEEIELQQPCHSHSRKSTILKCTRDRSIEKCMAFPGLGLIFALLASIFFSCASLTIKLLPNVHPLSILFGRSIIQLTVFLPVCIFNDYNMLGQKNERLALCARILFGSMAISGLYYSVRIMPLADASTIVFSSPAFTGLFACLLLKEPCGVYDVVTVVTVLLGVVLVCKPTFIFGGGTYPYQLEGTLAAVNSAVTQALVFVCLRKMKNTPSAVIIVTFSTVVAVVCAVVLAFLQGTIVPECGVDGGLYLACGIFSSLGQFLITSAAKIERAGPLSVIRTVDIIMAFLFQIALLGVYPSWTSIVGAVIICLAVLIFALRKWYKEKKVSALSRREEQTNT